MCGLAAYFLSLYPAGFNAGSEDFSEASYEEILGAPSSYLRQGSQFVMGKVQQLTGGRPATTGGDKPLSPKALKKALLRLATKGSLTVSSHASHLRST